MPTVVTRADVPTAVFGSWDGCISMLAVMVGLAASHHLSGAVVAGATGAVGGCFSMASGQYKSMDKTAALGLRVREAVVMGLATGIGGLIPVAPYLFPGAWQVKTAVCVALAFAVATAVSWVEAETDDDPEGLTLTELGSTYLLLTVTAAATLTVGLLAG